MQADLIIHNIGQLLTCLSPAGPKRGGEMLDVGLIENGGVAISEGKLIGVGPSAEVLGRFDADAVHDASGSVACPGFVDPHTHIVFAGDRLDEFEMKIRGVDYLEILRSGGGIISTVRSTRQSSIDELVDLGSRRLDKMLACGTTTCEIKTGYGLDTETELRMLSAIERLDAKHVVDIVPTFLAAHAVPPEFAGNIEGYVTLVCDEMLPSAWRWYRGSRFNGRVPFFADVFCEKNAFDLDQSRRVLEAARQIGFRLKAHVDEFTNLGGSRLAIEMGAVSIDHLDAISKAEVELLAGSETVAIVTPTVNFNLGSSHFADARRLIDRGCAVAVSTDFNPGSAPSPSQPMAMAISCRYQKLLPAEALNAATINAAHAIGIGERSGSIEVGRPADIVIFDTSDFREICYEFGGSQVAMVVKDGSIVYDVR